jgi:RNA polymerase sigma-70 factor (ECF subfamily)
MSDEQQRTDEDLARAARGGDTAAYDALVRRYLRPAMALAWQYVRRVEDAEDVVQEGFHRVVRALPQYDARRPFAAWFYAVIRNVARSAVSKDRRRAALAPFTLLEDEHAAPEGGDRFAAAAAIRAIDDLAPMQQACVRLCDLEGFTSVEAARMLGISEATVRTHVHRGRRQLRVVLRPREGILP